MTKTRIPLDEQRLVGVAIRLDDGEVFSLPAPNRHHDVIREIRRARGMDVHVSGDRQGFITDAGEFLSRKQALDVANIQGQIIKGPSAPVHGLFSEDVW